MTTEPIVLQPKKKKARIAPTVSLQPTNANEAILFHFVSTTDEVRLLSSRSRFISRSKDATGRSSPQLATRAGADVFA